nr:hypothetical protein [Bacteroidota bacterium]
MQILKSISVSLITIMLVTTSCKKQEGRGGDASIYGKVLVKHYNSTFTQYISEYPGSDIYVYTIYGDDISYGQRIKTNFKGEFNFKYLYPGNYKVYVYSLDSTLTDPSGSVAVVKEIHINGRKETMDAGTFDIFN